jgi:catechol 2,3-dioxygenase
MIGGAMDPEPRPRLGHTAISARDPGRVAEFYRDLLGLEIVRRTSNPLIGDGVLLSGDHGREDHELVFLTNPAAEHLAFRVDNIEQLRELYRGAKERGLQIPYGLDSGIALSFFVRDPEDNAVEIYFTPSQARNEKPPLSDPSEIDRLILGT